MFWSLDICKRLVPQTLGTCRSTELPCPSLFCLGHVDGLGMQQEMLNLDSVQVWVMDSWIFLEGFSFPACLIRVVHAFVPCLTVHLQVTVGSDPHERTLLQRQNRRETRNWVSRTVSWTPFYKVFSKGRNNWKTWMQQAQSVSLPASRTSNAVVSRCAPREPAGSLANSSWTVIMSSWCNVTLRGPTWWNSSATSTSWDLNVRNNKP